jgi:1-deoxy-D-xylulose-5-phosphate reductoisomerase
MVEFCDGSIKAQLGIPDMAVPIAYALSNPNRLKIKNNSLDWTKIRKLDFQEPDLIRFPCLKLAFEALGSGSGYCNAMNAANEVAVSSFLQEKIGFNDIPDTIKSVLDSKNWDSVTLLDSVIDTDKQARIIANDYIHKIS